MPEDLTAITLQELLTLITETRDALYYTLHPRYRDEDIDRLSTRLAGLLAELDRRKNAGQS